MGAWRSRRLLGDLDRWFELLRNPQKDGQDWLQDADAWPEDWAERIRGKWESRQEDPEACSEAGSKVF